MAWNTIASSLPADAVKINDNFNLIVGGGRFPRTSEGASFVPTDSVYDIGAATSRFNVSYINNLIFSGTAESIDNSIIARISDVTLSATASSIEFGSLSGDSYTQLFIHGYFVTDTTTSIVMVFNGDSASNYGSQVLYGTSSNVTPWAVRTSSTSMVIGKTSGVTTAVEKCYSILNIYEKTGNERTVINRYIGSASENYVNQYEVGAHIWNNNSDTLTSIKIYLTDGNFETSTNVILWGRK